MDKIIEHALKELKDKLEPWQIKSELNRQIDNMLNGQRWPFKTVSREYFLDVAVPVIQMAQNIEQADSNQRHKQAAEFIDRINYTSADFLTCVQKMEQDFLAQEAIRYKREYNSQSSVTDKITLAQKMTRFGKFLLNENNNRAIDLMEKEMSQFARQPIRVTDGIVRLYTCEIAKTMTNEAIEEHEKAFKAALKRSPYILEYGISTDSTADKLTSKLFKARTQAQITNDNVLFEATKAQIKIDHVNQYVIPHLKQEAGRELLMAIAEELVRADRGEEAPQSKFRESSAQKLQTAAECEQAIKDMHAREAAAIKGWSLQIKRGADGVYSVVVQKASGEKRETRVEKNGTTLIKTAERNRKEEKRELKMTQITNRAMEDTKSFRYVFRGDYETELTPTHDPKKDNEQKGHEKTEKLLEVSAERSTKVGKKGVKTKKARAGIETVEYKNKAIKVSNVGPKENKKEIASVGFKGPGASAEITQANKKNLGTPKATIEGHAVEIEGALGPLRAKLAAGAKVSAGFQLSPEDLIKEAVGILANEIVNGSDANATRVMDEVANFLVECLEKMPPDHKIDWGSIVISVGDFDLFKAEVKDVSGQENIKEFQVETSSPVIQDVQEDIQTIQGLAQERYPYETQEETPPMDKEWETELAPQHEIKTETDVTLTDDTPEFDNDEPQIFWV